MSGSLGMPDALPLLRVSDGLSIRCLSKEDIVTIVVLMFQWMTIIGQMSSTERQRQSETAGKAWRLTYALAVESVMLDFRVFIRMNEQFSKNLFFLFPS